MIECRYKFELEDSLLCAKYVYNSQKRKRDKFVAVLIPVLIVAMIAMLVFDAIKQRGIVWDIVLLVALILLELSYILIPIILAASTKKSFKKQHLDEADLMVITLDDKICEETLIKEDKEINKNHHSFKFLTSYLEDDERLILIFNKIEYVCLKKSGLNCDINKLKSHLNKVMSKNQIKK